MRAVDPGFWAGKRVLVTGHTGFKGSWLVATLHALGAEVTGFALRPATLPNLFEAARLATRVHHVIGDVRDGAALAATLVRAEPDIVFHLAGQALVSRAHAEPVGTFATNVMGTVHMLEALRQVPCARAAVMVTSDKCYRNLAPSCAEGDRLGGTEAYGASKAAAELAIEAYRHTYLPPNRGFGLASARAGNVFGGGDLSMDRLIPDLMRACARGDLPRIRRPQAVRPWQHVLDAVTGYLLLAEALWREPVRFADAWNFGPPAGSEWPVSRIATHVTALWGVPGWLAADALPVKEDEELRLRTERATAILGWGPRLSMPTALDWTVEAYRRLLGDGDTGWLDVQIARYAEIASLAVEAELADVAA